MALYKQSLDCHLHGKCSTFLAANKRSDLHAVTVLFAANIHENKYWCTKHCQEFLSKRNTPNKHHMQNILSTANKDVCPGFEFKTIDAVDQVELVNLVAETFSCREPLQGNNNAVKLEGWKGIVRACLKYKTCAESSFALIQSSTQKIAGFSINMDHDEIQMSDIEPFLLGDDALPNRLIFIILDHLECEYAKKMQGKKMFYLFLGGTHSDFEGRGLGKSIRALTLKIGEALGYDCFSVSASNPATQSIWKKLGLEIEKQILMKDVATTFADNADIVAKYKNYPSDARDALVLFTKSYK